MSNRTKSDIENENTYLKQTVQFQHELHEIDEDLEEMQHSIESIDHKMSALTGIILFLLVSLLLFFLMLFINGMIVHHDTGLDEVRNVVFTE